MRTQLSFSLVLLLISSTSVAQAEVFGGIDFPDGVSSFVDSVISYDCAFQNGTCPLSPFDDPLRAIGAPDNYSLSLGLGGKVELLFVDNVLNNSGDNLDDLHIFERGADVEATLVAIRPTSATTALLVPFASLDTNGDGFYEVGEVEGSTSSVDIDAIFTGFSAGQLTFDAVQLIDNEFEPGTSQGTHGADIDAVGAIGSLFIPVDADFDEDNDVDGFDFLIWQRGFGTDVGTSNVAPMANGNANGDQFIDATDLAVWEAQYGGPPPLVAAISTPEPSTLLLASVAGCVLPRLRRRV
jgi:hypothetical protein